MKWLHQVGYGNHVPVIAALYSRVISQRPFAVGIPPITVDAGVRIYERIGDVEASRNRSAEARAAYELALKNAPDSNTARRIRKKTK